MHELQRTYLPAAGHDWLLPLYDPLVKVLGGAAVHQQLIEGAAVQAGQRVLEIGCGTGSLAIAIKTRYPAVDVVGLDPDPKALDRARQKALRQRVSVQLDRGFANALPYADRSYDRVFSSFMLHHLDRDQKQQSLNEVLRVLKPGGSLHLLDFAGPHEGPEGIFTRLFHRHERLHDNTQASVLTMLRDAGFEDPAELRRRPMMLGHVFFCRACVPPGV